jgi:hypothetical protein
MRTEEEIRGLYKIVLSQLDDSPKNEIEKYFDWKLTTPTERMLKKERLDMIKAFFEWVLEEQRND